MELKGQVKRSQPSAAPAPILVGAAEGCDLLIFNKKGLPKEASFVTPRSAALPDQQL